MKADTQDNHFTGTSAADYNSDKTTLRDLIASKDIDTELYTPIGVELDSTENGRSLSITVICKNTQDNKLGKCSIGEISPEKYFQLFKRVHIVLTLPHEHQDVDIYSIDEI